MTQILLQGSPIREDAHCPGTWRTLAMVRIDSWAKMGPPVGWGAQLIEKTWLTLDVFGRQKTKIHEVVHAFHVD